MTFSSAKEEKAISSRRSFWPAAREGISRRLVVVLVFAGLVIITSTLSTSCNSRTVTFRDGSRNATLHVEVADTPKERQIGLMNRAGLGKDDGMLFDFGSDVYLGFWMKDTTIPLSIAFIEADGKVIDLKDMKPLDLTVTKPKGKYRYAVEANQGWFDSHGVRVGSRAAINI